MLVLQLGSDYAVISTSDGEIQVHNLGRSGVRLRCSDCGEPFVCGSCGRAAGYPKNTRVGFMAPKSVGISRRKEEK